MEKPSLSENPVQLRYCEGCGEPMQAQRSDKRFHSDKCRKHFNKYIRPYQNKAESTEKPFTEGVGNKNLVLRKIKAFKVPLPPLEEQKAIVQQVNALMALCDDLETQINNKQSQIEQWMQSCLREVFEAKKKEEVAL